MQGLTFHTSILQNVLLWNTLILTVLACNTLLQYRVISFQAKLKHSYTEREMVLQVQGLTFHTSILQNVHFNSNTLLKYWVITLRM